MSPPPESISLTLLVAGEPELDRRLQGAKDFLHTITDLKVDKGEAIDEAVGMWLAESRNEAAYLVTIDQAGHHDGDLGYRG